MSMMTNTLGRYFAGRFVVSALGVFASIFVLLVLVDYIEMVRKTSGLVDASAIAVAETSLFRVPQLLEKMMPFCILIGAMTCYLALSRRLELVVARAAGVSAWQFIAPEGAISDSKEEHYSVAVPLPAPVAGSSDTGLEPEHLITVRAYDRHDNMATAKVIVPAATVPPAAAEEK